MYQLYKLIMSVFGNTDNSHVSIWGSFDPNASSGSGGGLTNPLTTDLDMGGNQLTNTVNILTVPISADLNMENHSVLGVENLSFENTGTLSVNSGGQLLFNNVAINSGTGNSGVENPMTEDLDANNHSIINLASIRLNDAVNGQSALTSTFVTYNRGLANINDQNVDDVRLYLFTNESGNQPTGLDLYNRDMTNVNSISFYNQSNGTATINSNVGGTAITFNDSALITDATLDSSVDALGYFKNNSGANLDMGNYNIIHIQGLQFWTPSNPNLPHQIAVSNGVLQADGYDILTSNNIGGYTGWANGIAQSTISMAGENLQGVSDITFSNTVSLTTDTDGFLTYGGNEIVTRNNISNDTILVRGIATTSTPFVITITNDQSDSSYYLKGQALGLNFGVEFSCYIQYSPSLISTVHPVNVTQLADLSDDAFGSLTVVIDSNNNDNFVITINVVNVITDEHESICVAYQMVQCSFQED